MVQAPGGLLTRRTRGLHWAASVARDYLKARAGFDPAESRKHLRRLVDLLIEHYEALDNLLSLGDDPHHLLDGFHRTPAADHTAAAGHHIRLAETWAHTCTGT